MSPHSAPRPAAYGTRAIVAFYYHSIFFLAAALLAVHTVLLFLGTASVARQPLLLGVDGVLGLVAMIGSEMERHRDSGAKRSIGAFLLLLGIVQVALCAMTGGLASPYFLLLACTTVLAGLTLTATRAMYVTAILACAYVLAMRLTLEGPGAEVASAHTEADMITAVAVQVVFLLLAPALAARVASRQRDQMPVSYTHLTLPTNREV